MCARGRPIRLPGHSGRRARRRRCRGCRWSKMTSVVIPARRRRFPRLRGRRFCWDRIRFARLSRIPEQRLRVKSPSISRVRKIDAGRPELESEVGDRAHVFDLGIAAVSGPRPYHPGRRSSWRKSSAREGAAICASVVCQRKATPAGAFVDVRRRVLAVEAFV